MYLSLQQDRQDEAKQEAKVVGCGTRESATGKHRKAHAVGARVLPLTSTQEPYVCRVLASQMVIGRQEAQVAAFATVLELVQT